MSIGFLGVSSSQKTIDIFSGNASSIVDRSLQGTLSNYDSIRSDTSRLIDSAIRGSFDISSNQYYNTYLKESSTGWAESWYSEYKAVLALRADALQKKLQAAYNRVLEKSAYAEIKPNSDSVFAPYANRTYNVTDVNYKMPVSEVFYSDATSPSTFTVDPPDPANTTPVEWTQRIREAVQRWGAFGGAIDNLKFDRNTYDTDGDGITPLSDNSSQSNGGTYYNDPRVILGMKSGTSDAQKYNNVLSPKLENYISTNDMPATNSVYRIDVDYNSSDNGKYFRLNGVNFDFHSAFSKGNVNELTASEFSNLTTWANNTKTDLISNWSSGPPGSYSRSSGTHDFKGAYSKGSVGVLTTTEYNNILTLVNNIIGDTTNWTKADTAGALDINTGLVISNKKAAQLKLKAGGPKIQTGSDGNSYNVATNTSDKRWLVDPSGIQDITGDGIDDDLAPLRDGSGYGLWKENYSALDDKSTAVADNYGHIRAELHPNLVNPLLWDGSSYDGSGNVINDPYNLSDSRAEAFRAVARNAQVDAAVKGVYDAISSDPSYLAYITGDNETFDNFIKTLENSTIKETFANLGKNGFHSSRDFLKPFGINSGSSTTISQNQTLYDNQYKPGNIVPSLDFTNVTDGIIGVNIFGKATTASTSGTITVQYSTDNGSTWNNLQLDDGNGGTVPSITFNAEYVNKFPEDAYKYPIVGKNLTETDWALYDPFNPNDPDNPYLKAPYIQNETNHLNENPGNPDYSDPGEVKAQIAPDENGDGNPYNDVSDGSGGYFDAVGRSYNPTGYGGYTNILHIFADTNKDGNPFNDEPDADNPGEFLDDPNNPRYAIPRYEIAGDVVVNVSDNTVLKNKPNIQFRVNTSTSGGTATFYDLNDMSTPSVSDDVEQKFKVSVQKDVILPNSFHPWGSPKGASLYNLGIDYASVGANSEAWKDRNGLYTTVRKTAQEQIKMLKDLDDATKDVPITLPPTNFSSSYDTDDKLGNYKEVIPEFGVGDVDWSAIPKNIYDTLKTNVNFVNAVQMGIDDLKKTFVGKQYNDIIGGSDYDGKFTNFSISVLPGPLQFIKIADELASLAMGGNSMQAGAMQVARTPFSDTRLGPSLFYGHLSALSVGALGPIGGLPTIGLQGTLMTLPIPFAPMTMIMNTSYDIFSDIFVNFMDRLKKVMVESVQAQSYGASSGTAFDTYASRAEYHFSEPGFNEAMSQLVWEKNILGIPIKLDIGEAFKNIMFSGSDILAGKSLLGNSLNDPSETINNDTYKERLFDYKHSVQGAESRETDTGAFFSTAAFLSQFEMENINYNYWIGTQQNEEYVNMDMQRAFITAGKEIINTIVGAGLNLAAAAGSGNPYIGMAFSIAETLLTQYVESNATKMIYDFLYKDQNLKADLGIALKGGDFTTQTKVTTEAYDFIEPDKKPYEADSDFNYPPKTPLSFLAEIFKTNKPDFILDGYASTMRFRKANSGAGAEEVWSSTNPGNLASLIDTQMKYNQDNANASANGLGPRALAGRQGDQKGAWEDTGIGDINEVYVGSRKVSFDNLSIGFNAFDDGKLGASTGTGGFGDQNVDWELQRYTGSSSRIYNNRYNPSDPVNHESFSVGMYSGNGADGSTGYYDRRNQYSLEFTSAYDKKFSLFGSQALNPTIGGGVKISEIDKNKLDTQLLEYDKGGIAAVKALGKGGANEQQFGAGPDGTLNDLNRVLYEHLHLRADGSNLALINEYRDVFNSGLLKNVFISGQTYHPAGGGITSSLQLRFNPNKGEDQLQTDTRESYDSSSANFDLYNTPFLTRTRGVAEIYLSTYFAYKKRAGNKKA